jgi:hypothetical protein
MVNIGFLPKLISTFDEIKGRNYCKFYSIAMVSNFLPKLSKLIGIPILIVGIEIPKRDYLWAC